MPNKRQSSKQRRAAQNRSTRAQLAARRERAGELQASLAGGGSVDEPSSPTGRSGGLLSGLFGGRGAGRAGGEPSSGRPGPSRPRPEPVSGHGLVATGPDGKPFPGARATFVAVVLALVAFVFMLVAPQVQVDDRDELVPAEFEGLYLEARSQLTGTEVEADTVTFAEAYGPVSILILVVPLLVVGMSWWMHRRTGMSRPLTIGMLALAAAVFILSGLVASFIPALIALAVGSFQARKAELPARTAERVVGRSDDDGQDADVIDVDSVEEEDDEDLDDVDDEDLEQDELDGEDLDEDEDVEEEELDDEDDGGRRRRFRRRR